MNQEKIEQGIGMFTLQTVKNFVNFNTNNVSSNARLPNQESSPKHGNNQALMLDNASSFLDR